MHGYVDWSWIMDYCSFIKLPEIETLGRFLQQTNNDGVAVIYVEPKEIGYFFKITGKNVY